MFKDTFEIEKGDVVAITGGGGKTSLMFQLAGELSKGGRVLVTTTTKIYTPDKEKYERLVVGDQVVNGLKRNIDVMGGEIVESKLHGLEYEEVEELLFQYDYILIEADGAKMKPMKGWREDEPSIPPFATKIIGVANIKSIGKRAVEENIHRLDDFLKMVGTDEGEEVSLEVFRKYLQRGKFFKGSQGRSLLYINGVEERGEAAEALKLGNQVEDLYFGSIWEKKIMKHRRVDAVVMASGYSKRFLGEDKLLKKLGGIPVVEHLFRTLRKIPFGEIVVVGRGFEIEKLCHRYGYSYVENRRAYLGQSESVRIGIGVTSGEGVMFFTGDQPLLTEESILELLLAFEEENNITRPVSEEVPSSPVIFPERFRDELNSLTGDMGGREVIRKAGRITRVEFSDSDEFMDIDTVEDLLRAEKIMTIREKVNLGMKNAKS